MFGRKDPKSQDDQVRTALDLPPDVIVSPDTRRPNRVPPGQSRTRKWPVLDASGTPEISLERWKLEIRGLVARPVEWSWQEFLKLQRVKVFSDFHCVTRWSRLGNLWEGSSTRELLKLAGGTLSQAKYVLAYAYDGGWTTNMSLTDFLSEDVLLAVSHHGE